MSSSVQPELPHLPRVLSPDEWEHAQLLSPAQLTQAKFPVVPPPFTPRDATQTRATSDRIRGTPMEQDPTGKDLPWTVGNAPTKIAGVLTRQVIAPITEHPLLTAAAAGATAIPVVGPWIGAGFAGLMAKDMTEYAAQKAAEMSLSPEDRARAEADPTRIPGERAGVEAAMVALAPLVQVVAKAMRSEVPPPVKTAVNVVGGPPPGLQPNEPPSLAAQAVRQQVQDIVRFSRAPAGERPALTPAEAERASTAFMVAAHDPSLTPELQARAAGIANSLLPDAPRVTPGFVQGKIAQVRAASGIEDVNTATTERAQALQQSITDFRKTTPGHRIETVPSVTALESWVGEDASGLAATYSLQHESLPDALKAISDDSYAIARGGDLTPAMQAHVKSTMLESIGRLKSIYGETAAITDADMQTLFRGEYHHYGADAELLSGLAATDVLTSPKVAQGFAKQEADFAPMGGKDFYQSPAAGQRAADAALASAGGERFSGLPMNAELRARVEQHMADVKDAFDLMFAPANRSPQAKQAANILRATTGEAAARYETAAFKLDEFRRAIEPLPESDKLAFVDHIEGGTAQANPEFQAPADVMRAALDERRDAIRGLGAGALEHYITDYFPHSGVWADPEQAAVTFEAMVGGKRPLEGTKSFLKERTFPTVMEGIRLGAQVRPDFNPVDVVLLNMRNMDRYIMAHQSLNEMKDAGLVHFVRAGLGPPEGYQRISDKIATVFGPRTEEGATTIRGEYWAPEPVARIVNNYLSPGLSARNDAIGRVYDAYRGIGNTLNQAQLGLSAFHLGMTSIDAAVSRNALGLEYLAAGKPLAAAEKFLTAPLAPLPGIVQGTVGDLANAKLGTSFQWGLGAKIRAAYLDPASATPAIQALANAVKEAGGRVRMDSFYQNSAPEKMVAAWKQGEYGKATALSVPAVLEWTAKPLMEHIVPLQKLQVFGELAQKVLADLPPEATLTERRAALAQAWDSVDNRMGQLVYDNLFWNKTFKDLAMASVRSVGWNIGTIRELGGGMVDLAGSAKGLLAGDKAAAALTHRGAYVAALPVTMGMLGAVYQYLRTGQGPQELKDYFYPKTGEVDPDGNPERVQMPSYMKDVMAYTGHPWETVKHKVAPLPNAIVEMLQNQDFYGDMIRNPMDPAVKQAQQGAEFVAQQLLPFSLRNMQEQAKRGDTSRATILGNWFGITPAPRATVRSDAQNRMNEYLARRGGGGATPEDAEARAARSEILAGLRGTRGIDVGDAVTRAIEHEQLTPKDVVRLLRLAGSTPAQEKFKRLTMPQAIDVFRRSTAREQGLFAEALVTKVQRAVDAASQ